MVHLGVYASCRNVLPRSLPASRVSKSLGADVATRCGGFSMSVPACGLEGGAGAEVPGAGMLWLLLPQLASAVRRTSRLRLCRRLLTRPSSSAVNPQGYRTKADSMRGT